MKMIQLEIPIIVALTKIDIAPKNVAKETMQTIRQSLRRCTSPRIPLSFCSRISPIAISLVILQMARWRCS